MKKNVNVFIAVLLVAVLCGGVIWLQTADEEKLGWNINDSYGDTPSYSGGAAYTNATFAGPSAAEGGVMPLSSSSALRARTSYSYAGAYSGASSSPIAYSQSPIANSLTASSPSGGGLYTTSSQTFNSYGGGGNGGAAMGGAISNGRSNSGLSNPSLQGGAGVGSISPISYTSSRRQAMPSSGDNPAMMAAENPVVAMASAANAATAGMNTSFYGGMYTTADYSSADYGQYSSMFGGGSRMGVRGRQKSDSNGPMIEDTWLIWLSQHTDYYGSLGEDGWYFNTAQLTAAWEAFCESWNETMGPCPTLEQWLSWFTSGDGSHTWGSGDDAFSAHFVPVGSILPLLILALLYILALSLRYRKSLCSSNENK